MSTRDRFVEHLVNAAPEVLTLALIVVVASTAFGALMFIATTVQTLDLVYLFIMFGIAGLGVFFCLAWGLLQIGYAVRIIELVAVVGSAMWFTPRWPGVLVSLATWGAAAYLGYLLPPLIPAELTHGAQTFSNTHVKDRLHDVQFDHALYRMQRLHWARHKAWPRVVRVLSVALVAVLVGTIFQGYHWFLVHADQFGLAAAVLSVSLVIFYGLIQLLSRQRAWELDTTLHTDPLLSRPWFRTVLGISLVAAVVGLLLPADVSPLHNVNWTDLMNRFLDRVWAWQHQPWEPLRGASEDIPYAVPMDIPAVGLRSMLAAESVMALLYIGAAIGILIWTAVHLARIALSPERQSVPGLWSLLVYVLRWPIDLLGILVSHFFGKGRFRSKLTAGPLRNLKQRRQGTAHGGGVSADLTIRLLFRQLMLVSSQAGRPRRVQQTAHEFSEELSSSMPDVEGEIQTLAEAYQHVRYGARRAPSSWVDRAKVSLDKIREAFKR